MMEIRTDRVGLLVEQLVDARDISRDRVDGTTDEEFMWEPFDAMWSVRRQGQAQTAAAYGPGDWVLDREKIDPFAAGPLTTIAWRANHLLSAFAGRFEWTFGARETDPDEVVAFLPDADPIFDRLWNEVDRWVAAVEGLTSDELDNPGFGQYPHGLDPELPFIGIVGWMNREFIHHCAEMALLRDLHLRLG